MHPWLGDLGRAVSCAQAVFDVQLAHRSLCSSSSGGGGGGAGDGDGDGDDDADEGLERSRRMQLTVGSGVRCGGQAYMVHLPDPSPAP